MSRLLPGEPTPPVVDERTRLRRSLNILGATKRLQETLGFQERLAPFEPPPEMPEDLVEAFFDGLDEYGTDAYPTDLSPVKEAGREGSSDFEKISSEEEMEVAEHRSLQELSDSKQSRSILVNPETLAALEGKVPFTSPGASPEDTTEHEGREQTQEFDTSRPFESAVSDHVTLVILPPAKPVESAAEHQSTTSWPKKVFRSLSSRTLRDEFSVQGERSLSQANPVPAVGVASSQPEVPSASSNGSIRTPLVPSFSYESNQGGGFFSTLFQGQTQSTSDLPDIAVTSASPASLPISRKRRADISDETSEGMPSSARASSFLGDSQPMKKARSAPIPTGLPALRSNESWGWVFPFPGNTNGLIETLITWHTSMKSLYAHFNDARSLSYHPMFPYPPTKPKHITLISASFWATANDPHQEMWRIGPGDVASLVYNEVDTFGERREMPSDHGKWDSRFRNFLKREDARKTMQDRAITGDGRWSYIVIRGYRSSETQAPGRTRPATAGSTNSRRQSSVYRDEDDDIPPYVTIAWPTCAVTKSTECLHMLYPDDHHPPAPSQPPVPEIRVTTAPSRPTMPRMASMPVLPKASMSSLNSLVPPRPCGPNSHPRMSPDPRRPMSALDVNKSLPKIPETSTCNNPNHNHKAAPPVPTLRSWSSSATLKSRRPVSQPLEDLQAASDALLNDGRNMTLRRTILWFEKAGNLPLIEGYKTDLSKWCPWLEAFGRGEAKLMLWCETELQIKD